MSKVDKKTDLTLKTVESLKGSTNVFKEFIAAASNYQKATLKYTEEGRKMADALQKLGQYQNSDLGQSIVKLAELHRSIERYRDSLAKVLLEDMILPLQKSLDVDKSDLSQFEADFKRSRELSRTKIQKLEQNSKKAGKKGGVALQDAIKELDQGVKEAEKVKSEKLRTILLMERRKYCNFLTQCVAVINAEVDMYSDSMRLKDQQSYYSNLAASTNNLPNDVEALIDQVQERTFVQIQGSDDTGGYGYDYGSSYGDTSYDSSYTDTSYGGGYTDNSYGGLGTCTALYDFAGEQSTDLPFYAGEIITITADDDGSGWMTGELNGKSGIFPSSYVQRN